MRKYDAEQELNETLTSLASFAETYNQALPLGFPRASAKTLRRFYATHPLLFKKSGGWSIDRHRKKFMDWLSSYDNAS